MTININVKSFGIIVCIADNFYFVNRHIFRAWHKVILSADQKFHVNVIAQWSLTL